MTERLRSREEREREDKVCRKAIIIAKVDLIGRILVVMFFGMAVVAESMEGLRSRHFCGVAAAAWICLHSVVKAVGHAFVIYDLRSRP